MVKQGQCFLIIIVVLSIMSTLIMCQFYWNQQSGALKFLDMMHYEVSHYPTSSNASSNLEQEQVLSLQKVTNTWRAILIFEPNAAKYLSIFYHMLFNSWVYVLRVESANRHKYNLNGTNIIDIVVVVSEDFTSFDLLPPQCRYAPAMSEQEMSYVHNKENRTASMCIVIATNNSLHADAHYTQILHGNRQTGYPFLNSIDCVISFAEQYPRLYYSYDFILKTDDDVFLTPFFLYTFPNHSTEFIVGKGDYAWPQLNYTKVQLLNVSSLLHLKHCYQPVKLCFNHGAGWYGSPALIYQVANLTISTNVYLLWLFDTHQVATNRWGDGWFRGVTSLYSSEIAINHLIIGNESLTLRTFNYNPDYIQMDAHSSSKATVNQHHQIIHLHAWQNSQIFSKFAWHQKEHDEYFGNLSVSLVKNNWTLPKMQMREYCLAIAYNLHLNLSVDIFEVDSLLTSHGGLPSQRN